MKYIYWAPSCFGKNHVCFTFAANNKVSMKYRTYGEPFQVFSGTVIEDNKVHVEEMFVERVNMYSSQCTRRKFIAGDPDYAYQTYHTNKAMFPDDVEQHPKPVPKEEIDRIFKNIPDCDFPEHTVKNNKTWLENIRSLVNDFDPDLLCLEEPLPINVNINYKNYTNVVPYKSENFTQLIFEYLTTLDVDRKSMTGIFRYLDRHLDLIERQREYLELQDIKWEFLDISKWENYKYFGLENIPDHDMADRKWFSPEIMTDRIDYYYKVAERYVYHRMKRLNKIYPKVKD